MPIDLAESGTSIVPIQTPIKFADGRPACHWRLDAVDHGPVLRYGGGPGDCDRLGARDVWAWEHAGRFYMHYDGAGPKGWLACLAVSDDLMNWQKKGPALDLGKPGDEDSASASYGVAYPDGDTWHMFYLGTPHATAAPDFVPSFPYLTMKATGPSSEGPWTKQPAVVPFRTQAGTYHSVTASPGHIISRGEEYLQVFSATTEGKEDPRTAGVKRTLGIARTKDLDGAWTCDPTPILPIDEQIENSSLYFEKTTDTWFLFTNHIGVTDHEYTDAIWVYWSKSLDQWDPQNKAVVLDGTNCKWSKACIGLPVVVQHGNRLAILYDAPRDGGTSHMRRDVGLAWLNLPLRVRGCEDIVVESSSAPAGLSRRSVLKGVVATVAATPALAATQVIAAGPTTTMTSQVNPLHYQNKGTRLTISMWDYSWLQDGEPGGAYADLERCVAGAAERGYNTLRVDVFVKHQLQVSSRFEKNWSDGLPQWGMTRATFDCDVRRRVAELARLCRKHGIWLGLDSWQTVPLTAEATDEQCERVFTEFGQLWAKAIPVLRDNGVLERAVWVAPLNEVPWHGARAPVVQKLSREPVREGQTNLDKTRRLDATYRRINDYMAGPIRAALASDAVPLCYSSVGAEAYADRLSDAYDVVDVHFMPNVLIDDGDKAALEKAGNGLSGFVRFSGFQKADLKQFSAAWDTACRKHYSAMLQRVYDYHATACRHLVLPSGKQLQAIVTESFGPCYWPVHPDVNQEEYKRYNADAMRIVASLPLSGSSLSNYAEPLFTDLWNDTDWHWRSNTYFKARTTAESL